MNGDLLSSEFQSLDSDVFLGAAFGFFVGAGCDGTVGTGAGACDSLVVGFVVVGWIGAGSSA